MLIFFLETIPPFHTQLNTDYNQKYSMRISICSTIKFSSDYVNILIFTDNRCISLFRINVVQQTAIPCLENRFLNGQVQAVNGAPTRETDVHIYFCVIVGQRSSELILETWLGKNIVDQFSDTNNNPSTAFFEVFSSLYYELFSTYE